jgi:hypothetical protein
VIQLTLQGLLCGGCAVLQYGVMTEKLLEKLTVAQLGKLPTLNSNLPLFIVFNNKQQFDVIVNSGMWVYLYGWIGKCDFRVSVSECL